VSDPKVVKEDGYFTSDRSIVRERTQPQETLDTIKRDHRMRMKGVQAYQQGYKKGAGFPF
jgi:hypothetical protein